MHAMHITTRLHSTLPHHRANVSFSSSQNASDHVLAEARAIAGLSPEFFMPLRGLVYTSIPLPEFGDGKLCGYLTDVADDILSAWLNVEQHPVGVTRRYAVWNSPQINTALFEQH